MKDGSAKCKLMNNLWILESRENPSLEGDVLKVITDRPLSGVNGHLTDQYPRPARTIHNSRVNVCVTGHGKTQAVYRLCLGEFGCL